MATVTTKAQAVGLVLSQSDGNRREKRGGGGVGHELGDHCDDRKEPTAKPLARPPANRMLKPTGEQSRHSCLLHRDAERNGARNENENARIDRLIRLTNVQATGEDRRPRPPAPPFRWTLS